MRPSTFRQRSPRRRHRSREDRIQKLCEQLGGEKYAIAVGADLAVPADRDRATEGAIDAEARPIRLTIHAASRVLER